MALLICDRCGGHLIVNEDENTAVCASCGAQQELRSSDGKKAEDSEPVVDRKTDGSVLIKDLVESEAFKAIDGSLAFALGKDDKDNAIYGDLDLLQHLLITGVSGYGKTNCIRAILYSMHKKFNFPEQFPNFKLLLIDPKCVEFSDFNDFPTLLVPIITDARKASGALGWAVSEAMRRIQVFSDCGVKDIASYNRYSENQQDLEKMPEIVIVIDDLYQVYAASPKETEESILRIIQNGRICGMHLIIASLQAERKFLPYRIKNAIPSKITFALRATAESKYVIDRAGAEQLTEVGKALYLPMGVSSVTKLKCGMVTDDDINNIKEEYTIFPDDQFAEELHENIHENPYQDTADEVDPLYEKAIVTILESGRVSASFLQRKLGIGYSRATKLIDQLEEKGIIGPSDGAKPREIRISIQQWIIMKADISAERCGPNRADSYVDELDENLDESHQVTYQEQDDIQTETEDAVVADALPSEDDVSTEISLSDEPVDDISGEELSEDVIYKIRQRNEFASALHEIDKEIDRCRRKIIKYQHGGAITLAIGVIELVFTCVLLEKVEISNTFIDALTVLLAFVSIVSIIAGIIKIVNRPLKENKISNAQRQLAIAEQKRKDLIEQQNQT